jgi:hypothetical protein
VAIDSNNNLSSICIELMQKDVSCKLIGQYCYVFPESVKRLFQRSKIFYHFDEIYLTDTLPLINQLPRDYYPPLTDEMLFDQENIPNWKETMQQMDASCYFADADTGFGMNIGGKDLKTIKAMLREFGNKP